MQWESGVESEWLRDLRVKWTMRHLLDVVRVRSMKNSAGSPSYWLQAAKPAYVKQSMKGDLTIYEEEVKAFDYRPLSPCLIKPILGHA